MHACPETPKLGSTAVAQVDAFLAESSRLFEQILAAEDAMDGKAVEGILQQARGYTCMYAWFVSSSCAAGKLAYLAVLWTPPYIRAGVCRLG